MKDKVHFTQGYVMNLKKKKKIYIKLLLNFITANLLNLIFFKENCGFVPSHILLKEILIGTSTISQICKSENQNQL